MSRHFSEQTRIRYRILTFMDFPMYRVGTDGSVWSRRVKGDIKGQFGDWWKLKGSPAIKKKYWCVNLFRGVPGSKNKGKTFLVHKLVLEAFVGPCPEGMQCRHLDGNGRNNNLSNICWGTPQENSDDNKLHSKTNLGRKFYQCSGEKHHRATLTDEQVAEIRKIYVKKYGEQTRLARIYGTTNNVIHNIVSGLTWNHV